MLDILDSIIATAAVVLGLSLVVQAIQQILKQLFDLKSGYMRDELFAMFGSGANEVKSIAGRLPAISSFVEAEPGHIKKLVEELEKKLRGVGYKDLELLEDITSEQFTSIVKSLPLEEIFPPKTKTTAYVKKISEDLENEVARWFDLCKKAFQDHYERQMKVWAIGISAAVVIAMNVNIIDTYAIFSSNKSVRDAAIAMGERLTSISRDSLARLVGIDTLRTKSDSLIVADIKSRAGAVERIIEEKSFQLFGWQGAALERIRSRDAIHNLLIIPLGWLGMTLLVSLGAPFWYDTLQAVMGLKETLKKK